METIAITNWNKIVSPLYDSACCFLMEKADGRRTTLNIRKLSIGDKAQLCYQAGVNVVICGAISIIGISLLQDKNIKVISWICGSVDQVLNAYRKGDDLKCNFSMPGCGQGICNRMKRRYTDGCCRMQ